MPRLAARLARVFLAAGSIALVGATAATAATFKDDSGTLAAAKASGVTASGGTLKFTGTANPTGSTKFAGQIDFTSGQATGLSAPGTLTLKHSGHTAALKITKISATTLTAKLGSKSLTFPLSLSKAKSTPNSTFTGVSVTGVAVNLSPADAKALNSALKTSVYKSGKEFGTLSYNGIDRELIETGGSLTLCNDKSFMAQNLANGIVPSAIPPATVVTTTPCTGTNEQTGGIKFPAPGKLLGFLDTSTSHGRLTLKGGIKDTKGSTSGSFTKPIVDLLGNKSDLRATVTTVGLQTIGTVKFTKRPKIKITESGGSLTSPASSVTVKLNATGAGLLNILCGSSCPEPYSAGETIGYGGGKTTFK
jgi:hypothetical protein